jgi:tetratricopeptide (TPR) repeat protein
MQTEQINSWYYKGNALCLSERFDEAIKYFDKILKTTPNSKTAWGYKAHALSKLKKYDKAFECYHNALKC